MNTTDFLLIGGAAFVAYIALAGRAKAQAAPVKVGAVDQWTASSNFLSDYISGIVPDANNASTTVWNGGMSVDPNSLAGRVASW